MSVFYSYLFFLIFIFFLVHICFNPNKQTKAYTIIFVSLISYSIYALIVYWSYSKDMSFFQYSDQELFYQESQYLGNYKNLGQIFNDCFIHPIYLENNAAYFVFGWIAYIANTYLDGNGVFLQMLHVSFWASLIPIFVFKILITLVQEKIAYKLTLYYILCSFVLYYSPWILRDIHIALLYAIGLSILFSSFKVYKLIILSVLVFITTFFRLEHGLFMLFMPLLYVYEQTKYNKIIHYAFIVIALGICIALSTVIVPKIIAIQATLEHYIDFTQNAAEEGGLGKYILYLPVGIKQIVTILYSQISPFPSWNLAINARNIPQLIIGLVQMIAPLFWFLVWFCVIKSLYLKTYRKNLPSIIIYAGLFFIVFLLANTSNMNPRRLICMYPILYFFFAIAKEKYPLYLKKNMKYGFAVYCALCVTYLIIK